MTPEEVQEAASGDKPLKQYEKCATQPAIRSMDRRRWPAGAKKQLRDQERVALDAGPEIQPNDPEAIQALDLHVYQGML